MTSDLGHIADDVNLSTYMKCTAEGKTILESGSNSMGTKMVFQLSDFQTKPKVESKPEAKTTLDVDGFMADLHKSSTEILTETQKGSNIPDNTKPLEVIAFGSDTLLVSKPNAHAGSGGSPNNPSRVSSLENKDRKTLLQDQRCFHGYSEFYDPVTGELDVRIAPKQAWRLRPVSHLPFSGKEYQATDAEPCLPTFNTMDKSGVEETVTKSVWQRAMLAAGFHSSAAAIKAGGSVQGIGIGGSIAGDYSKSKSSAERQMDNKTKTVTIYKQPRAEVTMDIDLLDLTPECKKAILNMKDAESVKQFYEDYGEFFSTRFLLGGRLYTSQRLKIEEVSEAEANKIKKGGRAGFKLGLPGVVSGGLGIGHQRGSSSEEKEGKLDQESSSSWSCIGGDPGKCADIQGWQTSVYDWQSWRVFDRKAIFTTQALISHVAFPLFIRLYGAKTLKNPPSFPIPRSVKDYYDNEDLRMNVDNIASFVFHKRKPVPSSNPAQEVPKQIFERENLFARTIEQHFESNKDQNLYDEFTRIANALKASKFTAATNNALNQQREIGKKKLTRQKELEKTIIAQEKSLSTARGKERDNLTYRLKENRTALRNAKEQYELVEQTIKKMEDQKTQYEKELDQAIIRNLRVTWRTLTPEQKQTFAAWEVASGLIKIL
ncbi:hypothetical protein TWF506_005312 [Arthrobotrys conoides]|uniref:MACPF domain-containing protein n=1 Tax=Arthrobotrys conoides TaxID=74498 RepID=A0AAN8NW38_9PEZI